MRRILIALVAALAIAAAPVLAEDDAPSDDAGGLSLITDTPAEGFDLALQLARRAVVATQPDKDVLFDQRPAYSEDAEDLIAASHVVAVHFQTIAAANNYWRD
ncbi:MAG: hypothetical protein GVY32_11925 [Gammaproteobacteria bacterium]|jgi:hypothetical protein|nr:hypothetical protein [Gammaproteobacteria bacterium]